MECHDLNNEDENVGVNNFLHNDIIPELCQFLIAIINFVCEYI